MARRELQCPNGCAVDRFEALNAPLVVDAGGDYVEHDASAATYVCTLCRGVAIDLAAARQHMLHSDVVVPAPLVCPGCGAALLPPEDDPLAPVVECPSCGERFAVDEGTRFLHGGASSGD